MTREPKPTHAALEGCTAWHIPQLPDPQDLGEILGWRLLSAPYPSMRVLEHTCDRCPSALVSYELGMLGGYVIRKYDRSKPSSRGEVVSETLPRPWKVIEPCWYGIRSGSLV